MAKSTNQTPAVRNSVADADRSLDAISSEIRTTWAQARIEQVAALNGYVRIGQLLGEARARFPSNNDYGEWFRLQEFGFSTEWARRLRLVAENEEAVRQLAQDAQGQGENMPGVNRLLEMLRPEVDEFADADEEYGRALARLEAWRANKSWLPDRIPATIEAARPVFADFTKADLESFRLTLEVMLAGQRVAARDGDAQKFSRGARALVRGMLVFCSHFDREYEGGLGAQLTAIWQRGVERTGDGEAIEEVGAWISRATKASIDAWQEVYLR